MKTIDARGETCPVPVIMLKKALKEGGDENIREIVDNELAKENIEKMLSELGLPFASSKEGEDYVVTIARSDAEEKPAVAQNKASDCVLVISADQMGRGDEELGHTLIKNFLYALTESEDLPATILLYNSGVKLASENAETAADLKKLEDRGVKILVCGLCLNYFGLTDQLKVGGVSNMYAIVQTKLAAGRIIQI